MDADKIYDMPQFISDIDVMLRSHGLQIVTLIGQNDKPSEFTIIVKEAENEPRQ